MLEKFIKHFKPENDCIKAAPDILAAYKDKIPEELYTLWKVHGFGKYRHGLIEIINPVDFEPSLWTWLGREVDNYVPIAITAFGELFYYRKLTQTDEDICIVDIQFRNIETLVWSLSEFFDEFLLEADMREGWLREKLFDQAYADQGSLNRHEIFTFAPVFAMGGSAELKYLQKGNAQVYQNIVFLMTQ